MASGFTRFIGASTARIFGCMALGTTGALAIVFVEKLNNNSETKVIVAHALIVLLWLTFAGMFLIPSLTRQNLRKHDSFRANFFLGLLQILAIVLIVLIAAIMVRRFQVGRPDSAAVLVLFSFPLIVLHVLTFIFPGAYGRDLTARQSAKDAARLAARRQDDDSFIPEFASSSTTDFEARRAKLTGQSVPAKARGQKNPRRANQNMMLITWSLPFALLPFVIFFTGMIAGSHAHFIPNAAQVAFAKQYLVPMCIAVGLIGGVAVALDRNLPSKIKSSWARLLFLTPAFAGLAYIFGNAFLTIGAPVIHSQFNKEHASEQLSVQVTRIGRERKRRSCDYILHARGSGAYQRHEFHLCDVPPRIWERAQPGQNLQLQGFETPYGFRYSEIGR